MLVATSSALQLEGIPYKSLWEGNHWRKPWPYGIDDSTLDDTVVNYKKPAKPEPIPH